MASSTSTSHRFVPAKPSLTDNGIPFAELPKNRRGPIALYRVNRFDQISRVHDIEHRLTKPNHPWTNG